MRYRVFFIVLLIFFQAVDILGQCKGIVTDEEGDVIIYANIIVENTTDGTISNEDGYFELEVDEDVYVQISYLGYESVRIKLKKDVINKVILKRSAYDLDEVVVTGTGNPGLEIIKKAIRKRSIYRKAIKRYDANLYTKGKIKLVDAPEKIFGEELNDMDGVLDTARQGIIYLSESVSKFYYEYPDQIKEVIISSKVAEDDGTVNINSIKSSYFSIYDEYFEFFKTIVCPLADEATAFYNYKLEGVDMDQSGKLINKIAVMPKSAERPLFSGYLYIVGEDWNVEKVDLSVPGKSLGASFFNEFHFGQHYINYEGKEVLFSQETTFEGGVFGFDFEGVFNFMFTSYDMEQASASSVNFSETFSIADDAHKKDSLYWGEIRPVPLSKVEIREYHRKDSLKRIWGSDRFLDSLDRANNKFSLFKLLTGYNFQRTRKHIDIDFNSILSSYRYGGVEGHSLGLGGSYIKRDTHDYRKWSIEGDLRYGFSDKKWKWGISSRVHLSPWHNESISFKIYDQYHQIGDLDNLPVNILINTFKALFDSDDRLYEYRNRGAALGYQRELINGLYLNGSLYYGHRYGLTNSLSKGAFSEEDEYFRLNQLRPFGSDHSAAIVNVALKYVPFQKYSKIRGRKVGSYTKWPEFSLRYKKGIPIGDATTDYDHIEISIEDRYINLKYLGHMHLLISSGDFIQDKQVYFADYRHFVSNEDRYVFTSRYADGFKTLPHVKYSTAGRYFLGHIEHDFDGFILQSIPFIKKLGVDLIAGGTYLKVEDRKPYTELSIGIDNIGYKLFKIFRVDYVWSFEDYELFRHRFLFGVNINL